MRTSTQPRAEAGPAINTLRGEFAVPIAGALRRFDTRLSTVAAIETACGDRPIVAILNEIIVGRRARDQIPLIAAALAAADPSQAEVAGDRAAAATVEEAEGFVLAMVFALGFRVGGPTEPSEAAGPLDGARNGGAGASSRSAA